MLEQVRHGTGEPSSANNSATDFAFDILQSPGFSFHWIEAPCSNRDLHSTGLTKRGRACATHGLQRQKCGHSSRVTKFRDISGGLHLGLAFNTVLELTAGGSLRPGFTCPLPTLTTWPPFHVDGNVEAFRLRKSLWPSPSLPVASPHFSTCPLVSWHRHEVACALFLGAFDVGNASAALFLLFAEVFLKVSTFKEYIVTVTLFLVAGFFVAPVPLGMRISLNGTSRYAHYLPS